MRQRTVWTLLMLMTAMPAPHVAWGGDELERIWIVPFKQPQANPSLEYLEEALPALLTVAVSGSGESHSVVERQRLNTVLAEQSLTLDGLISTDTQQRIGKLLGATVMITGSFVRQDQQLLVTMRATDLRTGIVTATAEGRGSARQPGELVGTLYRRLARDLDRRLPDLAPTQMDEAPLSNLHFMKGLGHYHSARYSHALAEFMIAAEDAQLTDIARLWLANAYMAQQQYAHAYLELSRVPNGGSRNVRASEVAARMRACEQRLSPEDLKMIRQLAERAVPAAK
ncbi:MAG: CsgG/HfaB family protein [Vicinamibacterales bacterium]